MGSDCTLCGLCKEALTICVPGKGATPAKIMLVGQNPGVKEDCAGEAFIGPSGRLLDEMLADAGFDRDECFITNAVKCRTPQEPGTYRDRPPNTEEIDACRTHLTQEIHRVKPDVIIAMGDVALRALTRLSGIGNKRGKSFPLHKSFAYDCEVWPTYHPAYILHSKSPGPVKNSVTVDLRRVRDRGMIQPPVRWEHGDSSLYYFNDRWCALDIEKIDANGKIVPEVTQIAFTSTGENALVCAWPVQFLFEGQLVHHNGLEFDLPQIGLPPGGYDTMYLGHLLDENQPLGLEPLCVKYLGVRGWKEDEFAPLGSDELAAYNARDAVYTLRLFHKERELLGDRIKIYERIMLPARIALNECSRRGLWIDGEQVERTRVRVDAEIARERSRVITLASEWVQVEKFNPNSVAHVAVVLDKMGVELPKTRKTGRPQVDKGVLQSLDSPFAHALLEYRGATKIKSTYVTPYAKAAATANHRMHPEYTVIRTVVGRTSARNSNVQNLDRELEFFGAPPGAVFVKADYSALHFRLAAFCARAESIIGRYAKNPAWDPHRFFASRLYRKAEELIDKLERQIAKSGNFALLYLGDAHTLQNYAYKMGIELPLGLCEDIVRAWHATFPEFRPWYERVWDEVKSQGYVETATGRRRNFGDVRLLNRSGRAAVLREAVNMKVLGLEPDIALLGLAECHRQALPINGFFHDAISFEFDNLQAFCDNKEQITRAMIAYPMLVLEAEFGVRIDVPLEVEFTVYDKETSHA